MKVRWSLWCFASVNTHFIKRNINISTTISPFNTIQKDIIVGTLLGDASLERNKPTHNTRLRFDQTYPKHASYLESLYILFQDFTGTLGAPKIHTRKPDKRTGKVYRTIAFKTRSLKSLNYFYDLFYTYDTNGKRRKVVPANIKELLTNRALAYWIIDDGGINAYGATQLNTDGFTLNEVNLLQKTLAENFGLRTRNVKKRDNQWIIVIPVRQVVPLWDIVGIYLHSSITYKVKSSHLFIYFVAP